jgi:conjugal transfer pilus assembly protein TrbC
MPKESLQDYSIQSQKAGGVLVLRGLIDNSLKKTTAFIHSLNQHGTKAIIDPLSYQNFDVRHVPQIVVINDNHGCKWGRCNHTPLHDKITGNIALEYALKQIAQDGDSTRKEAGRFLSKLRGT